MDSEMRFTDLGVDDAPEEVIPNYKANHDLPPPRQPRRGKVPEFKLEQPTVSFAKPLMALYGALGMGISPAAPKTGRALLMNAEKCAEAWDALAKENESVRKTLEALTSVSTVGAVLVVHGPIIKAAIDEIQERREAKRLAEQEAEYQEAATAGPGFVRG